MTRPAQTVTAGVAFLAIALAGCRSAAPPRAAADRADSQALRKCTILIPLAYNDGTAVAPEVLASIKSRLFERFGGFTIAGTAEGTYRMADGSRADDRSLVLWVAVPPERVPELRGELAGFARELGQESMYFEVSGGTVEFVEPTLIME